MKVGLLLLGALLSYGSASAETPTTAGPATLVVNPEEWNRLEAAYANQQAALQARLGPDVFVASYRGLVHDGRVVTFATWTDSVKTALPKTDFVWLQDAKMTRWFVVSWSDLETAIGKLPELEQTNPPRYLTPANIPASYFSSLEKTFVPPKGFPEKVATGRK
jgi:hypothetical protein